MSKRVSLIGIQTNLTMDKEHNLREALRLTDQALAAYSQADMVVLPEYFYQGIGHIKKEPAEAYPDIILEEFGKRAKEYNTYMILGGVLNRREDGRVYNTALLLDRKGQVAGRYDKTHLFDALNAKAGNKESDVVQAGDHLFTYDTDFGKIGISICYDSRFPEIARTYALDGVKFLFTPAGFYSPRAEHWQALLSSEALLNGMYVMGVNLQGACGMNTVFCGRSLIADPWGIQVAVASDRAGFIQAYADPDYVDQIREAMGTIYARRPELYNIK